jgi:hypothetical protein
VAREAKAASPLTDRNYEITVLPMCNGQRPVNRTESDSVNDITSEKSPKIQQLRCDLNVMVAYKTHKNSLGGYSNHLVLIKHLTNKKGFNRPMLRRTYICVYTQKTFDYSLGGYYYREH